ncbi:hypothetical protein I3843_07G183700 [Carya illinoinensis]|uniref:Uncharacterized protein n=2 Tax=Carya illinoinensis TaxID=32201 RepID=A0A8T1Q4F9_CARIL|nr:uncharacterized protein LOC122317501 isoform X1 [Carya illinoinensis]KAG2699249.1 hypothetical protein I3760_07G184700 [Carya illinoinensis]KAG6649077.1 hypothetical protein CIPAW_07G187200 [Carya illinoinensis]KAG6705639.1 hypothetical protein I3842_07G189500 [Carya illinoinensis]KAG7972433.1 hypothetical protein I3843_07G183700 [Carya illinoinensis]
MASASLPLVDGGFIFHSQHSFHSYHRHSATPYNWGWRRDQETSMAINRTRGQAFQILANPNVSSARGGSNKEVIMVDPLEAKRLAAKQMKEIKAKEKFKRRRQIEAINGAWAMIGLTAGLVIEGQTGKSILAQLAEYWSTIVGLFVR